jgi:hypothetical protein
VRQRVSESVSGVSVGENPDVQNPARWETRYSSAALPYPMSVGLSER